MLMQKKLGPDGKLIHDGNELSRYKEGENLFAGKSSKPAGEERRFLQGKPLQ